MSQPPLSLLDLAALEDVLLHVGRGLVQLLIIITITLAHLHQILVVGTLGHLVLEG